MKMYDYIVVGAGLSGSIAARYLAEQKDRSVLVMDKRDHIAGNVYDYNNEDGILVQMYGPHIFHTNSRRVEEYVKKWGEWKDYFLECMVYMNEKYTPSPFNFKTIDDYFSKEKAIEIKKHIAEEYGDAPKATIVEMLDSQDDVVKEYAQFLYRHDYSLYTAKQWGISPDEIDISVLKRVPVLFSYKTGYFDDRFQAMPVNGFTAVVSQILNHENITLQLNTNAVDELEMDYEKKTVLYHGSRIPVVYTGAIDELMGYKYGRLPYRSLQFEWKTLDQSSYQEAAVVAYPEAEGYTRVTEYTKLPEQRCGKTTIAIEYPVKVDENDDVEPYYPIPTEKSSMAYERYRAELDKFTNISLCGSLAEYKYYNMDQVIEKALDLCEEL